MRIGRVADQRFAGFRIRLCPDRVVIARALGTALEQVKRFGLTHNDGRVVTGLEDHEVA